MGASDLMWRDVKAGDWGVGEDLDGQGTCVDVLTRIFRWRRWCSPSTVRRPS
jgi:hypothetical protein